MIKRISLANPLHQYIIGVIVNLLFLIFLYSFNDSFANVQLPEGQYQYNSWWKSDVMTYVGPARNFLSCGVFGEGLKPDYSRTIGYPLIISVFIFLLKGNWLIGFQLFQCFLFALIYPVFTMLTKTIYNKDTNGSYTRYIFIFTLISGVVFTHVCVIYTDMTFAVFFYLGILLGLRGYEKKSVLLTVFYIAAISFSSIVRPTNMFFPLVNILIAFVAKSRFDVTGGFVRKLIITTLIFTITCNLPSIRNYYNYNRFIPTNVVGDNFFKFYGVQLAEIAGNNAKADFINYRAIINDETDMARKMQLQEHYTLVLIKHYPMAALKAFIKQAQHVILGNYLTRSIGRYFNYDVAASSTGFKYQYSPVVKWGTYLFVPLYALLWLLCFMSLRELYLAKDYLLILLIASIFLLYIFPGLFAGYGQGRYRLPFEYFLIAMPVRLVYNYWSRNQAANDN